MATSIKFTYPAGSIIKANDDGSIRFHLITLTVDRDSEVLLPKGANVKNLRKNPVWLWGHNIEAFGGMLRPPIGKQLMKTLEITEEFYAVDVLFDEQNDPFAKMVAEKHRNGFMNASSVGFLPTSVSNTQILDGQKGVTYEKFEVLEGSSVPIPSNPAALQQREWGEFLDACKGQGFNFDGIKSCLKMAGWEKVDIEDALPKGNQISNYVITDVSEETVSENRFLTEEDIEDLSKEPEIVEAEPDFNNADNEKLDAIKNELLSIKANDEFDNKLKEIKGLVKSLED